MWILKSTAQCGGCIGVVRLWWQGIVSHLKCTYPPPFFLEYDSVCGLQNLTTEGHTAGLGVWLTQLGIKTGGRGETTSLAQSKVQIYAYH